MDANPGKAWNRFWFSEGSLVHLAAFRILVLTLAAMDLIAYGSTVFADAQAVSNGTVHKPWNPIYLFEIFQLEPIGHDAATVIFWCIAAALVCGILGFKTRVACFVAGALCLYWTGLSYSFGKVHHEKVAYAFALLSLPLAPVGARLSIDSLLARLRKARAGGDPREVPKTSPFALFPIRLVMVTLAIGYGFSGFSKLVIAGPGWADGYTLMGILIRYNNDWSSFVVQNLELSRFMSVLTLIVQGTFPLVLFFPRTRWFYLPAALGFHLVAWKTMDTGPYITLWFFLIAFFPLNEIPSWVGSGVRSRKVIPIVWRLAVAGLPALLILFVYHYYFPWYLYLALIPPAIALVLPLTSNSRATVTVANPKQLAWLDALDWSKRLTFAKEYGPFALVDERGVSVAGGEAKRAAAKRLPLVAPVAFLFGR